MNLPYYLRTLDSITKKYSEVLYEDTRRILEIVERAVDNIAFALAKDLPNICETSTKLIERLSEQISQDLIP